MRRAHRSIHTAAAVASTCAAVALIAATLFGVAAIAPATAGAAPPVLSEFCNSGALQCGLPRGIAVDPTSGDVYVADQQNGRVQKFDAWGEFLRTWGWDVVASGPGDTAEDRFEVCVPANGDVCKGGVEGGEGGQLAGPQGITIDSAGNVYVAEGGDHRRVQKFDSEGNFELAFGGDVVAFGPSDSSNDEVQEVAIVAGGGTFKLGFANPFPGGGSAETGPIPFDASAAELEAALEALPAVNAAGGSVQVSGGPGDAGGTSPYLVTFEGNLGGDEVPQMTLDFSQLAAGVGAELQCSTVTVATTIAYQWLRNGVPIDAATAPTYTITAADEGAAIQCQVTASNANAGSTQVANPPQIVAPFPPSALPVAPASIDAPAATASLMVGSGGGQTLTCDPNEAGWEGSPAFSYRWYRNGVLIGGASESTYVVTGADLATPAAFQCAVTGTNATAGVTKVSSSLTTSPGPSPEAPRATASTSPPSAVATLNEGGAPEICRAAAGDACKAGIEGTGNGQFGSLIGPGNFIAPSPDGQTIYVGDEGRIQEFDTGGNYLSDLPDPEGLLVDNAVKSLAVDPNSGDLYLVFFNKGTVLATGKATPPNVHRLDAETGVRSCELQVNIPTAVAVDAAGHVYVFEDKVFQGTAPGNHIRKIIEFDSSCEPVGVFDQNAGPTPSDEDKFSGASTGLAASSACGIEGVDLFVSNPDSGNNFVRLYGPPPHPDFCPPPAVAPAISDQYAVSVGVEGATVRADINPFYWNDARYYVQYGTGKCSEGGCEESQPLPPGSLLTEQVLKDTLTSSGVFLSGLEPATAYHYRFVAQSSGGGPVFGVDPDGSGPGEPSLEEGLEGTFITYPSSPEAKTDCPNQDFRTGFSASLPNCRAYELVSPLDKNNSDIATDEVFNTDAGNFQLASPDGNRATYSSFTAFASPQGSAFFNQYLSSRDPEAGWSTHSISPPRSSVPLYPALHPASLTQFKAFTEDLCSGWFIQDTNLALLPEAPPGVPSIYRRDDGECGEGGYELITPVPPPGFSSTTETQSEYYIGFQGVSADSSHALLRADAVLAPDACKTTPGTEEGKGIYQVYLHTVGDEEMQLVSVLPGGKAACVHSSGGTAQGLRGYFREDNVHNALSEDASRVFWSTSASGGEIPVIGGGGNFDQPGPLYVRLNPTEPQSAQTLGTAIGSGTVNKAPSKVVTGVSASSGAFAVGQTIAGEGIPAATTITGMTATTLTLSASAMVAAAKTVPLEAWGPCSEPEKACSLQITTANDARFWGAASTGNTAIYTTGGGLFEYDVGADASTEIAASGVQGVMGMSEDASRVYFVSSAVLSGEQENSEGEKALAGEPNLYLHERGSAPVFVATLAAADANNRANHFGPPSPIAILPDRRLARISPDGLHAAFLSAASLTGYDSIDVASGQAAAEVFLYEAGSGAAGELACISCNPSGARPQGRNLSIFDRPYWAAAQLPGWESQLYTSRSLAADGGHLFFESFEGLVLRDTNGRRDVYEWQRASSSEECEKSGAELYVGTSGGCISLISSGKSSVNTEFLDASASGSDVFFMSAGNLLPHDFGLMDVYDARAGGGFPPPEVPTPPCEGEACQSAPAPPQAPTPASSTFEGAGNVTPGPTRGRCAKGKRRVVRGGKARCVKKQKRQRKRHAKHKVRAGR